MKNTDLRVGNLVSLSGSLTLKVYEIHEDCFYSKDAKGSSFKSTWSDLKPIPLTEEILLKCGLLLYDELDGEYRINETRYSIHKVTNFDGFLFCDGNNVLSDIKYLHQLQNLYHSLTGQELKIEL